MELGLAGSVALITGGTSGIGLCIARRFLDEGARVAICGRDPNKLGAALESLDAPEREVFGMTADVGRPAEVALFVDRTLETFGTIDTVVSNAGTHLSGGLADLALHDLEAHVRTKIFGPWELARCVAPHMRASGGGSFILIIGQAGKVPGRNIIASAVTNAAQHAFVKSLSDDLGRDNILVNAVCPSRIASPLTEGRNLDGELYLGRSLAQQEANWGRDVPLGHWGEPDDIADSVLFLASERARFIVGSNIDVDGGYQRMIV
jgi:NAD(P)-dependent dehydrogenase (short-subunit alcohol dehydrogenase family)